MVDPVGPKQGANVERRVSIAPVSAVAATRPSVQAEVVRAAPSTMQAMAKPLAEQPPVDAERVARIKKAIQEGKFPLVPSTIADRLLALKLEWNPNEKA